MSAGPGLWLRLGRDVKISVWYCARFTASVTDSSAAVLPKFPAAGLVVLVTQIYTTYVIWLLLKHLPY